MHLLFLSLIYIYIYIYRLRIRTIGPCNNIYVVINIICPMLRYFLITRIISYVSSMQRIDCVQID